MQRARKIGLAALGALVVLVLCAVAAVALDMRAHRGKVARNVALTGQQLGGLHPAEVAALIRETAAELPRRQVRIEAGDGGFTTSAGALGATVDEPATAAAAMRAGRNGALPARVWSWLWSFVRDRTVPLEVRIQPARVWEQVRDLDSGPHRMPTEPGLEVRGGRLVAVAGKNGRGIDPAKVVEALPDALGATGDRVATIRLDRGAVPPRFGLARAEALVAAAEALVRDGLRVRAGDASAMAPARRLRAWLTTKAGEDDLELAVDADRAGKGLVAVLPDAGTKPVDASFTVNGDSVSIVPARTGTACCAQTAPARVLDALVKHRSQVTLALRVVQPRRTDDDARNLKIAERVSTFTTPHKCCEPRVHNIHRIADLMRGQVIEPGETFSVNKTIGRRTTGKGFVSAPVIENGQHSEDIGGGISQFATTTFNAAFFAGLEFGEYQSHSLYISRYPYGREATMGYPHPDLVIKNVTPYGILLWPSYTDRSLTVSMFSTKWFKSVAQTGQTKSPKGTCTLVRTERTRVLPDDTRKLDAVFATYRREEGLNCDGSKAPPPKTTTSRSSGSSASSAPSGSPSSRPATSAPAGPAPTAPSPKP